MQAFLEFLPSLAENFYRVWRKVRLKSVKSKYVNTSKISFIAGGDNEHYWSFLPQDDDKKTNKTDTISSALGAEESTIFLMNTYTQIIYILLYHTKVVS